MGSTRYPGKVLMDIAGKPMLWHLIKRLRICKNLDEIAVATSMKCQDDAIVEFCNSENIHCYRGSEEDVLARLLGSLESRAAEVGVVVYGDNPLIDPCIVDEHIELFKTSGEYDWVGNDLRTTFPPGMDVEVFSLSALRDAALRTVDPSVREHGTLYIRQHPKRYRLLNVEAHGKNCRPDIHLGIDTQQDVRIVVESIVNFKGDYSFSLEEIIDFLDRNPQLRASNRDVIRRWRKYRND